MSGAREGSLYRHYKGGIYRLLHFAKIEATMQPVVVYQCDDESDGRIWVRPLSEWLDSVHTEGPGGVEVRVARFEALVRLTD